MSSCRCSFHTREISRESWGKTICLDYVSASVGLMFDHRRRRLLPLPRTHSALNWFQWAFWRFPLSATAGKPPHLSLSFAWRLCANVAVQVPGFHTTLMLYINPLRAPTYRCLPRALFSGRSAYSKKNQTWALFSSSSWSWLFLFLLA